MSALRVKIDKLRRLAESDNLHEAALAQKEADRLAKDLPDPPARPRTHPAYPHQLPGAIRVPTPLGKGR